MSVSPNFYYLRLFVAYGEWGAGPDLGTLGLGRIDTMKAAARAAGLSPRLIDVACLDTAASELEQTSTYTPIQYLKKAYRGGPRPKGWDSWLDGDLRHTQDRAGIG